MVPVLVNLAPQSTSIGNALKSVSLLLGFLSLFFLLSVNACCSEMLVLLYYQPIKAGLWCGEYSVCFLRRSLVVTDTCSYSSYIMHRQFEY